MRSSKMFGTVLAVAITLGLISSQLQAVEKTARAKAKVSKKNKTDGLQ